MENDFLFVAAAAIDVVIAVAMMKFDSSPDLIVIKNTFFLHHCDISFFSFLCVLLLISDIIIIELGFIAASGTELYSNFSASFFVDFNVLISLYLVKRMKTTFYIKELLYITYFFWNFGGTL